jgi:hypothetical protein
MNTKFLMIGLVWRFTKQKRLMCSLSVLLKRG